MSFRPSALANTSATRWRRWSSGSGHAPSVRTRPIPRTPTGRPPATRGMVKSPGGWPGKPSSLGSGGPPSGGQKTPGLPTTRGAGAGGDDGARWGPPAVQERSAGADDGASGSCTRVSRSSPKNSPRVASHESMVPSISWLGRCTNAPERRASNASKRRRSSRSRLAWRRSSMTPARHVRGIAITERNIWSARTASSGASVVNGPRPCIPAPMAIQTVVSIDRLTPPGPKRRAAQRGNGRTNARGDKGEPGIAPGPSWKPANATNAATTSAAARNVASTQRRRDAVRSHVGPAVIRMMSAGTSVSAVRTFEKNRVRQTSQ